MGDDLCLGIDVGTSGVRGALFDATGALVAEASVACPYETPEPGWAEADAGAWWRAVVSVLERLGPLRERARGVAIVGQAPTAVLVDGAGAPVAPAVLWLDTRAAAEAEELGVHAYYLGPKLLWLARHAPRTLARARRVLQSHAFVAARLTGEEAIDPSTAALTLPLFDLDARAFTAAGCQAAGVWEALLPPLRGAHEILGGVTSAAARDTGLREGTPVACGGGDFAAATLGAGVTAEGEACLMLGTAGNLLVPRPTPGHDARLIHAHHVGVDAWLSLGGTLSGGAQEWLRAALGGPSFEALEEDAARTAVGADGLLFLPYLQGERTPIWDVTARGSFVGLGLGHGRAHLWRALLEGVALSFADIQGVLAEGGVVLREVVAANGGGRSAAFRQILCDALGVPLSYAPRAGGTVAGAALLAAVAAGLVAPGSVASTARAWRGATVAHEPNLALAARYRELGALRRRAYEGLRPVFAELARGRGAGG